MKNIFIILIFFTSSCGFNPIYISQKSENLIFSEIQLVGNQEINNKVISSLSIKEDETNLKKNQLILDSFFEVVETSKDSKGKVTSYRSKVMVKLLIKEEDQIKKNKNFIQDFTYNNRDNKFDLVEYQSEIKDNLINKIIEEVVLFMNLR